MKTIRQLRSKVSRGYNGGVAMKVYRIKVNGKLYEVEIEVVENRDGEFQAKDFKSNSMRVKDDLDEHIKSPMQGTVVSLKVNKGDRVSKGSTLMILEAMKMENEIISNTSGVVEDIFVSQGQNVNSGDVLLVISQGR